MRANPVRILGICLLGVMVIWGGPSYSYPSTQAALAAAPNACVFSPAQQRNLSTQRVLQDLASVNVVYLGETHDQPADHQAQLAIIQALHQRNSQLAIALEMFQHPYQAVLEAYLADEISEAQLREQSEYDQRWGFPWEYYAPILRFAKAHQILVLALNTPSEITRKVARGGLESLTPTEQQMIPPSADIRTDNDTYRQRIKEVYEQIHQNHGSSDNFERFFLAQVLWDETMADRIAQFLTTQPQRSVVVLAGQGHIAYGYGIPSRVERRQQQRQDFSQRSVLLNFDQTLPSSGHGAIADYLWKTAACSDTKSPNRKQ